MIQRMSKAWTIYLVPQQRDQKLFLLLLEWLVSLYEGKIYEPSVLQALYKFSRYISWVSRSTAFALQEETELDLKWAGKQK